MDTDLVKSKTKQKNTYSTGPYHLWVNYEVLHANYRIDEVIQVTEKECCFIINLTVSRISLLFNDTEREERLGFLEAYCAGKPSEIQIKAHHENVSVLVIKLNKEIFKMNQDLTHQFSFNGLMKQLSKQTKFILTDFINYYQSNTCFKEKLLYLKSEEFIYHLFNETLLRLNNQEPKQSSIAEKMEEVRLLLENNLAHPFTLKELAQCINSNPTYLKVYFKQIYGTSVISYFFKLRMNKAKEMLHNSDCSLAEIAAKVGFKYATHFSTAYKSYYGINPHKVRRSLVVF
ncbi:helix-turn-helix domain-containing protein [Pedobacter montanisoli]|uniref:AraC family transcriptional regulator n=1 Tax=Pedobacter montanisoli TaxID=2923277 RepID=A0ABS9ZUJ2_9SPHI|nr:AraC family transcriptional regulator [Pedobacter montanisoli]MCJ0742188.1 AraC family transcriptional regulator [Pedobacter montanisoli]